MDVSLRGGKSKLDVRQTNERRTACGGDSRNEFATTRPAVSVDACRWPGCRCERRDGQTPKDEIGSMEGMVCAHANGHEPCCSSTCSCSVPIGMSLACQELCMPTWMQADGPRQRGRQAAGAGGTDTMARGRERAWSRRSKLPSWQLPSLHGAYRTARRRWQAATVDGDRSSGHCSVQAVVATGR